MRPGETSVSRRQMIKGVAASSFSAALSLMRAQPYSSHEGTAEDFVQLMTQLSNWNRWGKDDQLGAINLITPAKRKQSVNLVKEGVSFSMARSAEFENAVDNPQPIVRKMTRVGVGASPTGIGNTGDTFFISYHGYAHTHMDSLCHFLYNGKMYNGYSQDVVTEKGAANNSIINFKHGIITRGVLMDMARHKGVDYLEPRTPIYPEDLDAWEKKARVKVGPGDVILVRTGRWARRDAKGPWPITEGLAGLHMSCAKWLHAPKTFCPQASPEFHSRFTRWS